MQGEGGGTSGSRPATLRACQSLGLFPRHFQHPCRQGKRASPSLPALPAPPLLCGSRVSNPGSKNSRPSTGVSTKIFTGKRARREGGERLPLPRLSLPPRHAAAAIKRDIRASVGNPAPSSLPSMSRSTFPPDGKVCPGCSLPFVAFPGEETKETIEIDVRAYRRLYHRKRYRKTCSCPGPPGIVTAPAPASLIPKGLLGISVFVEILAGKYAFHTPLGRILAFWEQSGLVLSPGTVDSALVPGSPVFSFPFTRRLSHAPGRTPSPTRARRDFMFSRKSRGKRATDGGSGAF